MRVIEVVEAVKFAYKKSGSKVTRKYRCTSGPRKGQVRASPAACNAPINVRKSQSFKATKGRAGTIARKKAKLTKTYNPVSRRVARLNKPRRRKVR